MMFHATKVSLLAIVFVIGWPPGFESILAHQQSVDEWEDHYPQQARDFLARVICLKIDDRGRLRLDRDSWLRHGPRYEELIGEQVQKVAGRSWDPAKARQWAVRRVGSKADFPVVALTSLMSQFYEAAGGHKLNKSRQLGSNTSLSTKNSKIDAVTTLEHDVLSLDFLVERDAERRFSLKEGRTSFRLNLNHAESYLNIDQDRNRCRILFVDQDDFTESEYSSFLKFVKTEPAVAQRVLQVMQEFGVDPPPTIGDTRVSTAISELLRNRSPAATNRFESVVQKLAADEYETRHQALEELKQELRNELKDGKQDRRICRSMFLRSFEDIRNPEIRSSLIELKRLVDELGGDDRRFTDFIVTEKLMESPRYLVSQLPHVAVEYLPMWFSHLKQITEADPGDNVQAWTDWVKKQEPDDNPSRSK